MEPLKTAVAGLGRIAWEIHLPQIYERAGFELTGIVDPLPERRDDTIATFGEAAGYDTVEELLAGEELDLLVVATPTHLHRAHVEAAFAAGVDVLLEKPMAPTQADAEAMAEAALAAGRKLMIYQPHRCRPQTAMLHELLSSGRLGKLYQIDMHVTRYSRRNDWQAQRQFGGGMLNNYGAHYLDLLMHLTSFDATVRYADMRCVASIGDADDVVRTTLTTADGVSLNLHINMACAISQPYMTLYGATGSATFSPDQKSLMIRYFNPGELSELALQPQLAANGRSYDNQDEIPWREESLEVANFAGIDFYDNVEAYYRGQAKPLIPVSETLSVIRAMADCRRLSGWDKGDAE